MLTQITREEDRMLVEAKEIFKYLDRKIYDKIPEKIKRLVETYNGEYSFEYDKIKVLNEQNISEKTKAFIIYIFYPIASPEEKKIIKLNCENAEKKQLRIKQERNEKYSCENLFKKSEIKKEEKIDKSNIELQNSLENRKQTLFSKIVNKIKSIFYKKG